MFQNHKQISSTISWGVVHLSKDVKPLTTPPTQHMLYFSKGKKKRFCLLNMLVIVMWLSETWFNYSRRNGDLRNHLYQKGNRSLLPSRRSPTAIKDVYSKSSIQLMSIWVFFACISPEHDSWEFRNVSQLFVLVI